MGKKNIFIGIIIGASAATIIAVLIFTGMFGLIKKDNDTNQAINPPADDYCKLKYYKIEDGKSNTEKLYGYKVNLNGKCDEYFVMDKDNYKSLFSIIVNKKSKRTKIYTTVGSYKNENLFSKDFYGTFDNFDTFDLKFYMINEKVIVFDNNTEELDNLETRIGIGRNIYAYQTDYTYGTKYWGFPSVNILDPNEFQAITEGVGGIPWRISDFEIDENKNIVITTSIAYPLDGVHDSNNKYYGVVMKLREIEVNPEKIDSIDINSTLQEYGLDDFAFEKVIKFEYLEKDHGYEVHNSMGYITDDRNITKTITQAYAEKVAKIRGNN